MPEDYNINQETQEEDCASWSVNWRLFAVL